MTMTEAVPPDMRVVLCVKFAAQASSEERRCFKDAVTADKRVVHVIEILGTYDLMFEVACSNGGAIQEALDDFSSQSDHLLERFDANFISRRSYHMRTPAPHCLWVPSGAGRHRLDHTDIDLVTAEGDYVRLHANGRSWLLHTTMNKVAQLLATDGFLRLNRSAIVRLEFISRLVRDERHWTVVLVDGSRQRIAKGRARQVLVALKASSSINVTGYTKPARLVDKAAKVNENLMHYPS